MAKILGGNHSVLDVAVLVVAELDLVAEAMATASRAVVVVNKIDIVGDDELAEVAAFTARVVADRLGQPVPVFPLSALAAHRRSNGFDTFAALSEILARAGDHTRAAVDDGHGETRRLRGRLDEAHDKAVAGALAASAQMLAELSDRHVDRSPEDLAESIRSAVANAIRVRAQNWYAATAADLDSGMRQATGRAMESLRTELAQARRAADELLQVELFDVIDVLGMEPARTPSFDASVHPGWEELVSAVVKRLLPARMRRRQVLRELDGWRLTVVPRPFGRARATLQDSLRR